MKIPLGSEDMFVQETLRMRKLFVVAILACAFLASGPAGAEEGASSFAVSGDVTVTVEEATAQMVKIGGRIPAITINSAPASVKQLGTSFNANLFFSKNFDPQPGKYPIAFSYRNETNTLGASFRQRGGMFSHDTKGTAEFVEFGDTVRVVFEFETFSGSEGSEDRQRVLVKGEAICAKVDIF
jgi:hypothetical protein